MFTFPIRVYYEDTDAGRVVFYANYLKFFERARTEWLRHLGIHQSDLMEKDQCMFVVVDTQVKYKRPAKLDDQIFILSTIEKLTASSVVFAQKAYRGETLLVESLIRICAVHSETFRPISIPTHIRNLFESAQES
ncbi:tol-pal system-associated acyl-CoA thioesterase [Basilea psittacipulmonis]|nr:tol-pal system-associated acyl-CoA thioesterase [Basilea psittacipulmonis]